jgi:hypothetical protein
MLAIDARISSRSNGYGHPCAIAPSEPPNEPERLSEVSSPVSSDYQHGEATTTNATAPSSQPERWARVLGVGAPSPGSGVGVFWAYMTLDPVILTQLSCLG